MSSKSGKPSRKKSTSSAKAQASSGRKGAAQAGGGVIVLLAALALVVLSRCGDGGPPATPLGATTAPVTLSPESTAGIDTTAELTESLGATVPIVLPLGRGAEGGFWTVLFTAPSGSRDPSTYTGGIDQVLADALAGVTQTLDIAAYEFNQPAITRAVLDAKARGVRVRVVTDDEDGLAGDPTTLDQLQAAGIPIVTDDRSALMHDKFMILDSQVVVTGSWNYTVNDTYRNNNNALILRSQAAVADYQAEFDEMFAQGRFGPTSPANTPRQSFTQDGVPISIYFGPEDEPMDALIAAVGQAQDSIRFMTFSFTYDQLEQALLERAGQGVQISGVFETTGSNTSSSAMRPLGCAGIPVRQDGNPFVLHHKVFIIDDRVVVTGSFNYSSNAVNSNDENLLIIADPVLAAQYAAEWQRRWEQGITPTLNCS